MTRQRIFKMTSAFVLGLAILLVGAWLVFVPFPQEEGYEFVAAWGKKGSGPGEFHDPTGIIAHGDHVFVADARNARIQVFDFAGIYQFQFGTQGKQSGQLERPMNLTIANNELYVPDYWNDRIEIFMLEGTPIRTIGHTGSNPGEFKAPGGVAVTENGDVFVADFYNQRVQRLNADDSSHSQLGTTGQIGSSAGAFNYPTDVALGPDGTLYVADGYNDRIQRFSRDGQFLHKWGGPFAMNIFGPFNGWFATVTSIAVDKEGNVFVVDFYNDRIQKFTSDGTFLTAFGKEGTGPGELHYPLAVTVADDGTVFVTDFGNNRVQKWQPK